MKYRITYARVEPNPVLGEQAIRYITAAVVADCDVADGVLFGYAEPCEAGGQPSLILPAGAWLSVEGVEE